MLAREAGEDRIADHECHEETEQHRKNQDQARQGNHARFAKRHGYSIELGDLGDARGRREVAQNRANRSMYLEVHSDSPSTSMVNVGFDTHRSTVDPIGSAAAVRAEITRVIEAVRPALEADGASVDLVSFDAMTGIVEVELRGACVSCPSSSQSLKLGVEQIMKDRVGAVTAMINVVPLDENATCEHETAVTL